MRSTSVKTVNKGWVKVALTDPFGSPDPATPSSNFTPNFRFGTTSLTEASAMKRPAEVVWSLSTDKKSTLNLDPNFCSAPFSDKAPSVVKVTPFWVFVVSLNLRSRLLGEAKSGSAPLVRRHQFRELIDEKSIIPEVLLDEVVCRL